MRGDNEGAYSQGAGFLQDQSFQDAIKGDASVRRLCSLC
jgi:hypothetical protein